MALIPQNDVARTVLDHMPCSHTPVGGFHGGHTYCIGVLVRNVAEAFELGKTMGAEATRFGDVGFDRQGNQTLLVFRDALVFQGTA